MNNIYNFPFARDRPIENCADTEYFQYQSLKPTNYVVLIYGQCSSHRAASFHLMMTVMPLTCDAVPQQWQFGFFSLVTERLKIFRVFFVEEQLQLVEFPVITIVSEMKTVSDGLILCAIRLDTWLEFWTEVCDLLH